MRFKNVKHAEYKILQHLKTSGSIPLSVVLKRGVPGYQLHKGVNQELSKKDKVALKRFRTATANICGVIDNMLEKRIKNVPEDDLDSVPSPYAKHFDEEDVTIEPEDDLQ